METELTAKDKVISYRHVRNHECIYIRIGDTDEFQWAAPWGENITRSERHISMEIHYNQKFIPLEAVRPDGTKFKLTDKN